jgi:hypothetical protein
VRGYPELRRDALQTDFVCCKCGQKLPKGKENVAIVNVAFCLGHWLNTILIAWCDEHAPDKQT